MDLPHFNTSRVATNKAEAVTGQTYEFILLPPDGVVIPDTVKQEAKNITGLDGVNKLPEIFRQQGRGHTRIFHSAFLDDTTLEITVTFNINLHGNDANDNKIYKCINEWARLIRDPDTGALGLKTNTVGSFIINHGNVRGITWRQITGENVLITNIEGLDELSFEDGEAKELTVTFLAEKYSSVLA